MNKFNKVERRFLVGEMPDLENVRRVGITQGYISTEPTIRVREMEVPGCDKRELTIRTGKGMEYQEVVTFINKDKYQELIKLTIGNIIEKTRYKIRHGNHMLELDVHEGVDEAFHTVKVVFGTIEEAKLFIPPSWVGREVTKNREYSCGHISTKGYPVAM